MIPEWAREAIDLHSVFEEAGVEVEVRWSPSRKRVEAVCNDVPPFVFPAKSWYVTELIWKSGHTTHLLQKQLEHIQEYLNGN